MTDPASMAIDGVYGALGVTVTYRAGGAGAGVDVLVIPTQVDPLVGGFETGHVGDGSLFEVRASQVAAPAQGDTVGWGAKTYVVQATPRSKDARGLIWVLDCSAQ